MIHVNGRPGRSSQRLRAGDLVRVELPAPQTDPGIVPEARALAIVFEDEHLLVIDKPAGLVVHPGAGVRVGTLVHALVHHHPPIAGVGGAGRPGIVHRLDRGTSGLMVVAKTERAYRALVEAIRARTVARTYRALAWGVPRAASGRLEAAIARDPRDRKRMAVARRGGRPAATRWSRDESFGVASLLTLDLESGRTHQIRVHLAHLGHPVAGDPVYGGREKALGRFTGPRRALAARLLALLPRQALHAARLGFAHPVHGAPLHFEARLPDDLAPALDFVRGCGDTHERARTARPISPSKRSRDRA
jgi:23S rRNA pseudouridine1911/1915/1917 synthase